jgi:hypothetical protein
MFLYHPKNRKYLHSEVFMLRMTFHLQLSAILFMMERTDTSTYLSSINACYYCPFTTKQFAEVIDHLIIHHPASELKYKIISDLNTTQHYKTIYPQHIQDIGKYITANSENKSISIHPFVNPTSPCKKRTLVDEHSAK